MKQFEVSLDRFENDVIKYLKSLSGDKGEIRRGFFKKLTRYNFNDGSLITSMNHPSKTGGMQLINIH